VTPFTGRRLGRSLEIDKTLVFHRAHRVVIILVQGDFGASGRRTAQALEAHDSDCDLSQMKREACAVDDEVRDLRIEAVGGGDSCIGKIY
jgi:hypothetical protein